MILTHTSEPTISRAGLITILTDVQDGEIFCFGLNHTGNSTWKRVGDALFYHDHLYGVRQGVLYQDRYFLTLIPPATDRVTIIE